MDNNFKEALEIVQKHVPEFRVISKQDSWFHRLLSKIFPKYGTQFWTTVGYTTAYPTEETPDSDQAWLSLFHEGRHAIQAKRLTRPLLAIIYLFPQWLGVLALTLAPIFSWWFLLSLIFLAPIPGPGRMWAELEAYKLEVALNRIAFDVDISKWAIEEFMGPNYYWMWPFRKWLEKRFVQPSSDNLTMVALWITKQPDRKYVMDCINKALDFKERGLT